MTISSSSEQQPTTNYREIFRVPVLRDSGLAARIRFDDCRTLNVFVSDITESGIRVEFLPGEYPMFSDVTTVDVEFRFRGASICLGGEVSRLSEDHCVILLAIPKTDEQRQATNRWHDVKLVLQQLWLKSRIK